MAIQVPRVRDCVGNREVLLGTYELLSSPRAVDEELLRRILLGISCRDYERCCRLVPEAFGLSPSTISRRFIQVSSRKLKELMERDLSVYDISVLFIDGKSFAEDEMIIALEVTSEGKKVPLAFIPAATENATVVKDFLWGLIERGLKIDRGILCVIDGAKDLVAGIKKVFSDRSLIQRSVAQAGKCAWLFAQSDSPQLAQEASEGAYEKPTYEGNQGGLDAS